MKEKLPNINKFITLKESLLRELLLIIMLLRLKFNTFQKKLKKLLLNTSQLRGPGKEFNIYQLRLKLFTIQKEKNMLQLQVDIFKVDILDQLLSTHTQSLLLLLLSILTLYPPQQPIKPFKLQLLQHQLIKLLVEVVVLVLEDMPQEDIPQEEEDIPQDILEDIMEDMQVEVVVQDILLVDQQEQLIQQQQHMGKDLLQEHMELGQIMFIHQEDHYKPAPSPQEDMFNL